MKLVKTINRTNTIMLRDIVTKYYANSVESVVPIIPDGEAALINLFTQLHNLEFKWNSGKPLIKEDKAINNYCYHGIGKSCYNIYEDRSVTYGAIPNILKEEIPIHFTSNMVIREH